MTQKNQIIVKNKKEHFSYTITSTFFAGMQLLGSEIKSIRIGQVNISEAYCILHDSEVWIQGMDIAKYKFCHNIEYNSNRNRKLLLKKIEIQKIKKQLNEKGMTLVPIELIINEKGLAKIKIGLGKGKKLHDKRESLKKKDAQIEMARKKREK